MVQIIRIFKVAEIFFELQHLLLLGFYYLFEICHQNLTILIFVTSYFSLFIFGHPGVFLKCGKCLEVSEYNPTILFLFVVELLLVLLPDSKIADILRLSFL